MNAFSSENVARLQMAFGHQADSLTNLPPFKGARPNYVPNVLPLFHHLPAVFHFLFFLHLVRLFYRSFVHSFNPSVMYTIIQSVRFFALCSFIRSFAGLATKANAVSILHQDLHSRPHLVSC